MNQCSRCRCRSRPADVILQLLAEVILQLLADVMLKLLADVILQLLADVILQLLADMRLETKKRKQRRSMDGMVQEKVDMMGSPCV